MTKETFVNALRSAVPDFEMDAEWSNDDLGFPIINDFARYICATAAIDPEDVENAVHFLEKCLNEGDSYIRDLVHECLETLSSCVGIESIKGMFGPLVTTLWTDLFDTTNQRERHSKT
jgi:hypothetical protein